MVDGNSMNYCSHEINPFSKMDIHDCSFSLENKNYHIRDKYFFDTKGMLHEYWTYLPEGPLTYSLEQLNSDPKFFESIGGKNLSVELIGDKIIDGIDTLKIERILQSEGLIFVIDKMELRKRGKRSIYQYE